MSTEPSYIFYGSLNFESIISQIKKELKEGVKIKLTPKHIYAAIAGLILASIPKIKSLLFDEKNADLGAAKLGTDTIIGGILLFEARKNETEKLKKLCLDACKKYEKDLKDHKEKYSCLSKADKQFWEKHFEAERKYFESTSMDNDLWKKHVNFINKIKIMIKNFLYIAKKKLDPHPSVETRIAYLEKLLTTEDQKKKLSIERENLKKLFSDYEEIEKITSEMIIKVMVRADNEKYKAMQNKN